MGITAPKCLQRIFPSRKTDQLATTSTGGGEHGNNGSYELRPRGQPRPNYYETRITHRTWTHKKRSKAKPKRTVRQQQLLPMMETHQLEQMEEADLPETMDVDTYVKHYAIERLNGEMSRCEIGLYDNCNEEHSEAGMNSYGMSNCCCQNNNTDYYVDTYPVEPPADCYRDDNLEEDNSCVYYKIPVISGGVVSPSWPESQIFVTRTESFIERGSSDDNSSSTINVEQIPGRVTPTFKEDQQNTLLDISDYENDSYLEEMDYACNEVNEEDYENTLEVIRRESDEECGNWNDESVVFGDMDVVLPGEDIPTLDGNNAGETSGPEDLPLDNLDLEQPSNGTIENTNINMIFGENARWFWPLPSIFPGNTNTK